MTPPERLQDVTLAERLLALAEDFSAHDRDAFVKRADILALAELIREAAAALSVRGDEVRRNDDRTLDEVVGNGYYHLEQMDTGRWSLRLGRHLIGLYSTRAIKASIIENDLPATPQAPQPVVDATIGQQAVDDAMVERAMEAADQVFADVFGSRPVADETDTRMMRAALTAALAAHGKGG